MHVALFWQESWSCGPVLGASGFLVVACQQQKLLQSIIETDSGDLLRAFLVRRTFSRLIASAYFNNL